jgi:hypothetical protein
MALPGQTVIPRGWGESMVLYSEDGCAAVVDGAPPGINGRLYKIPAGKPIKVPFEVGRHLLNMDQFPYLDVVRVSETETEAGITYDTEGAKQASLERSSQADDMMFKRYVSDCVEDFVKKNKPVPQPSDRILQILKRRAYRLEDYGIFPIGWKRPVDEQVAGLQSQLKEMQDKMAQFQSGTAADDELAKLRAENLALRAKKG